MSHWLSIGTAVPSPPVTGMTGHGSVADAGPTVVPGCVVASAATTASAAPTTNLLTTLLPALLPVRRPMASLFPATGR